MSMRIWVRGTTVAACAVMATGAVLVPAHAAEPASPVYASAFGALAFSPVIPSTDDIANAKKSEASTAAESAKIEALLKTATEALQSATVASMGANNAYTNALLTLQDRQEAATIAKAKATAAAKGYKTAKTEVGQLAGSLYKSGGLNPGVQSLLTDTPTSDPLYQASTLMALSATRSKTFASAASSAAASTALQQQADAAQKAANTAAKDADAAKASAQAATDAQAAVVAENTKQRGELIHQLATLHNTTVSLETTRVNGLEQKAQEDALAAQIAASAQIPVPTPPASQQGGNQAGNTTPGTTAPPAPANPPATQPVAPAPVAPPVVTAPKPNPPVVTPPVTPPVTTPPVTPPVAPPVQPSGSYIQVMVNYAMSKVGGPYVWGGNGPVGFDCSGLVQQAFAAAGVNVPRTGTAQFWAAPTRVPLSQMRYGDLLVFDDDGTGNFGHIAIYIGNGQVVQALNPSSFLLSVNPRPGRGRRGNGSRVNRR